MFDTTIVWIIVKYHSCVWQINLEAFVIEQKSSHCLIWFISDKKYSFSIISSSQSHEFSKSRRESNGEYSQYFATLVTKQRICQLCSSPISWLCKTNNNAYVYNLIWKCSLPHFRLHLNIWWILIYDLYLIRRYHHM